jgi:anti-anti-sigma factor
MLQTLLHFCSKASTRSDQAVSSVGSPEQRTALPPPSSAGPSPSRTPRLAVEVCVLAGEVLVCLKGEAGYLEAEVLDATLLPLNARRPLMVTFNLTELSFISSLVLGVFVRFCRSAVRWGGRVRLTALQPQVREAIEQAGLAMMLLEQDAAEGRDRKPCAR